MNDENAILAYYQGIRDGSIVVGRWVRSLYETLVDGIENKRWFYDQRKASNTIRFIERFCHHYKGTLAPEHIRLSLWQRAAISAMFGIVDADGQRQFTECIFVVGRKQGKTLIAAGIMTYLAYCGEYGSEIYFLAPKLDQADLCYSALEYNVNHEPDLRKRTKSTKSRGLYIKETNTMIRKLPFTDKKSDGYNPAGWVADEVAAWTPAERGLKQWEVMVSGTGSRQEPFGMAISSAGYENDGIYDELYKRGTAFLMGNSREQHILPILYMVDDVNKWDDINELRKSLPGLSESVSVKFILKEIDVARESLSKKREFICKYCNIKQTSSAAWLSTQDIRKCFGGGWKPGWTTSTWRPTGKGAKDGQRRIVLRGADGKIINMPKGKGEWIETDEPNQLTYEDFRHNYALGGIDLSLAVDLTAAVVVIEKDGVCWFFTQFFMPENKVEEATARDGLPYRIYQERGLLTVCGENTVDYHAVHNWYNMLERDYEILTLKVGYDRYSAAYLVQDMQAEGYDMESVSQGSNLTGVLIDMEGMIKDGRLRCANDNDLMKAHMLDSALKFEEGTNRRRLIKINPRSHIDGMAALSDAICMRHNHYEELQTQLCNVR